MAVTQMIDYGFPFTMTQNQIYAMPPQGVYRFFFNDGNTYQASNDPAFGSPVALAAGTDVARAFVRCTTGNGVVTISRSG